MKNLQINPYAVFRPKAGTLLCVLLMSFFVMLLTVGFLQILIDKTCDFRTGFMINSILQCLFVFILPASLTALLCVKHPCSYLGLNTKVYFREFVVIVIFFILSMPAINYLIQWNANIHLPDTMSELYDYMRQLEDNAQAIVAKILGDTSWWGLISGVLVIGVLTGIAEEMFFRAGLQRALLQTGLGPHFAIWFSAIVFSFVHFQFFGFVPRLLLGAAFGYFYYYSGSIWVSSFAHAFNNSVVVVFAWLMARGYTSVDVESIGCNGPYEWLYVLSSVLATIIFIYIFGKLFIGKKQKRIQ